MDDLISRQAAIDALAEHEKSRGHNYTLFVDIVSECAEIIRNLPSTSQWIPVKTRPMMEDERKYYEEVFSLTLSDDEAVIFDCKMPEDGQEVWVCSRCGNVWDDICIIEDGIGPDLEGNGDWLDIVAWMPYFRPEPWRGAKNEHID